jgi:hypothetical protein
MQDTSDRDHPIGIDKKRASGRPLAHYLHSGQFVQRAEPLSAIQGTQKAPEIGKGVVMKRTFLDIVLHHMRRKIHAFCPATVDESEDQIAANRIRVLAVASDNVRVLHRDLVTGDH